MKERPILFNGEMVRAILDGRKTQTRRAVKPPEGGTIIGYGGPGIAMASLGYFDDCEHVSTVVSPYGKPGDRLWVRETFCPIYPQDQHYNGGGPIEYDYAATYKHGYRLGDLLGEKKKWTPSIHMPRRASRIQLEIISVRVERLKDISDDDVIAEGTYSEVTGQTLTRQRDGFQAIRISGCNKLDYMMLWDSIHGPGSWDVNPWVWVVEFNRVKGGAS